MVILDGLLGVDGGSWGKTVGDICCQIAVKRRNIPNTNALKLLYKGLELLGGSSILLGMPKGGLDTRCSPTFALVHFVLETPLFCSLRVVFYR
jgi:hypothetical protein